MLMQLYKQEYPFSAACSTPPELITELESITIEDFLAGENYPRDISSLLAKMLQYEPERRWRADQLLESPWFRKFGIEDVDSASEVLQEWVFSVTEQTPSSHVTREYSYDCDGYDGDENYGNIK